MYERDSEWVNEWVRVCGSEGVSEGVRDWRNGQEHLMPHEGFVNSVMPSRYEANVFVEVVPIYTSREVFHARRHSKNRNQINSENTFLRKKRIPIPNIFFQSCEICCPKCHKQQELSESGRKITFWQRILMWLALIVFRKKQIRVIFRLFRVVSLLINLLL